MEEQKRIGPAPVPSILRIAPYVPGKPIEELEREYGVKNAVKLASNENPLGPPKAALEALVEAAGRLHRYPDGRAYELVQKLSETLSIPAENLVLGNGSDEIIQMLALVFLGPGDEAVMCDPAFLMYEISVRSVGGAPVKIPWKGLDQDLDAVARAVTDKTRLVFLTNPNNPTGRILRKAEVDAFLDRMPEGVLVVLDEAYIEFNRDPECAVGMDYVRAGRPVAALRTFSKAYGLAGLRVGYGVMPAYTAGFLHRVRLPFNTNLLAQAAALAALADTDHVERTVAAVHDGLDWLYNELERLGIPYHPSQANFFLVDVGRPADEVFEAMLRKGVIVRSMRAYGLPDTIRVTVGVEAENERFIRALEEVLA